MCTHPWLLPACAQVVISGGAILPITALLRKVDRLVPLSLATALTAILFGGFVLGRAIMGPLPAPGLSAGPSGPSASIVRGID